jgi:hypothetical protein
LNSLCPKVCESAVRDMDEADVEPPVSALFDEILLRAEP